MRFLYVCKSWRPLTHFRALPARYAVRRPEVDRALCSPSLVVLLVVLGGAACLGPRFSPFSLFLSSLLLFPLSSLFSLSLPLSPSLSLPLSSFPSLSPPLSLPLSSLPLLSCLLSLFSLSYFLSLFFSLSLFLSLSLSLSLSMILFLQMSPFHKDFFSS